MMNKKHEVPEFQVIRLNEANAKFFVASYDGIPGVVGTSSDPSNFVNTYSKSNANVWF